MRRIKFQQVKLCLVASGRVRLKNSRHIELATKVIFTRAIQKTNIKKKKKYITHN